MTPLNQLSGSFTAKQAGTTYHEYLHIRYLPWKIHAQSLDIFQLQDIAIISNRQPTNIPNSLSVPDIDLVQYPKAPT